MYAVIDFKGRQHKVEKGAVITVDLIDAKDGESIDINQVVLVSDDGNVKVGAPYVEGAKVVAEVKNSWRSRKVMVFKHRSKKDYHKMLGHRQRYTDIIIKDIVA